MGKRGRQLGPVCHIIKQDHAGKARRATGPSLRKLLKRIKKHPELHEKLKQMGRVCDRWHLA